MKIYLILVSLWFTVVVAGPSDSKGLRGAKWMLGRCPRTYPVAVRELECSRVCHPVSKTCQKKYTPRPFYDSKSGLKLRNCARCIDQKYHVPSHESTHAPTSPPSEDHSGDDGSNNETTTTVNNTHSEDPDMTQNVTVVISNNETNSTSGGGNASHPGEPRDGNPGLESGQGGVSCPFDFPVLVGERRCRRECAPVDKCDYVIDGFVLYDTINNISLEGCPECYIDDIAPIPTDLPKETIPGLESGQVTVPCPADFPVSVGDRRCSKECAPTNNCDYVADGFVIYDADNNISLIGCPECYVNDVVPTPPLKP